MYIPNLLRVRNNISIKNMIKCLNQLNHRGTETLTILGVPFSISRNVTLIGPGFLKVLFSGGGVGRRRVNLTPSSYFKKN